MHPTTQQQQTDHTANFFWLLVLICIVFIGIWWFKPAWIVLPVFWLRRIELDVLIWGGRLWNSVSHFLHLPVLHLAPLDTLKATVLYDNPETLHFNQFASINVMIGNWLRWPVMVLLCVLAVIAYFRHWTMVFRQKYDMQTLKTLESENWPQIQPVLSLDLVKENLKKGPWAMAKTPLDYCKDYKVAKPGEKEGKKIWLIDKGLASRLFILQLGPLWRDLFNLPVHVKALIVIFISRAENQPHVADRFLTQIAASASSGKLDFTGVNEQLVVYQNSKVLRWLRPRHAYVRTMMATLLEIARADGVLATAEFLWLKPVDRKLWYMLNSVGRQTAVIEVSGVFAHWKAERAIGRAMKTPIVKEAVKALSAYMEDILFVSGEETWHSSEA